jgi:hypothetical protein
VDPAPSVQYGLSSDRWRDYTVPFTLSGDGTHEFYYRAKDSGGNSSGTRSGTVRIDGTAPVTKVAPAATVGTPRALAFTATDALLGSGVVATYYQVDDGEWAEAVGGAGEVSGYGSHTVQFYSVDVAGNVEQVKQAMVEVSAAEDDSATAVALVEQAITDLPAANALTLADRAEVESARAAYDKLTDREQALVDPDLVVKLAAVEAELAELVVTPTEAAAGVTSVPALAADETGLTLPDVPDGFEIRILSTTDTGVVNIDGTVTPPLVGTSVDVVFVVTETATGQTAQTGPITVSVPARTLFELEGIDVSPSSLALTLGDTGTLSVSYLPSNTTDSRAVSYAVSVPGVVAVADDGSYTATGVGSAVVKVSTSGDRFSASVPVTVRSNLLTDAQVTLSQGAFEATGSAVEPGVQVVLNGVTLIKDADYTIAYSDNVKPGTGTVLVTGIGAYQGEWRSTFTIYERQADDGSGVPAGGGDVGILSVGVPVEVQWPGGSVQPNVVVQDGTKTLVVGVDYTLTYWSNTIPGTGKVTITGKGAYSGVRTVTFKVAKAALSASHTVLTSSLRGWGYAYTGKQVKPRPAVYYNGVRLSDKTDYTLSFGKNKNVGTGTVTVKARPGSKLVSGTSTLSFKIVPKTNKVKKATVGKRKVTVTWTKVSKVQKISKYQLQYRQQGSDTVKSKAVSAKKLKATVKGLKKGKRYEVRIRSYKTVKGVRHYSLAQRWVTTKKIK